MGTQEPPRTAYLGEFPDFEADLVMTILSEHGIYAVIKNPRGDADSAVGPLIGAGITILVDAGRVPEAERLIASELPKHLESIAEAMDEVDWHEGTPEQVETEFIELHGHIIDSLVLPRALDEIVEASADYSISTFEVGREHTDPSFARIMVRAPRATLDPLLRRLADLGATIPDAGDVALVDADRDGVFPDGFYSTTNLQTEVRVGGTWISVEGPEMDCGIVVRDGRARTIPMIDVRTGDPIVCGYQGVKVAPLERPRGDAGSFSFMSSEVSSEKPQWLMVQRIAELARRARADGKKILWVLGPAVVHTGSIDAFVALIRAGWVDIVFAGNALATHDAEAALFGTSLGVSLSEGIPTEHGHEHHIRAINTIRRAGSFRAAVETGVLTRGIMYELVRAGADVVLAGSVRDDGPMPEVITDMIEAQRQMRARVDGIGLAIMVSTMLHSIATGNLLPASVPIVCVDINPAAVTKLLDRGSIQSVGMVTDVGLFVRQLGDAFTT
jgi:lysine-ketoglutarate reductase/saccharopine dehydrogenase-like protein (TIGR00300 family)